MPGDPRECRQHAVRCAELATNVKNDEFREAYLALSKQWEMFAVELEGAEAMVNSLNKNAEEGCKSQ
jgi:hypothetical protein